MTLPISSHLFSRVGAQMIADPELPRDNPTTSFWQLPPHSQLSEIQSAEIPQETDYAVIGSGLTGCSIAKHLLDLSDSSSVTVLEARTLCSGATGRNGGLLTSFVPDQFSALAEHLGLEQAVKIARFANRTLEKMHELGNSSPELKTASEVRRVRGIICYDNEGAFEAAKKSVASYEEHVAEHRGRFEFLSVDEACKSYNVRAGAGAALIHNGAFWPYRLITTLWANILSQHSSRLLIEANTPVTRVSICANLDSEYPYTLATPRGEIRAKHVIHATNGYTGHLLPKLRGTIFPVRGIMSTQKPTPSFGSHGLERAWSFLRKSNVDPASGAFELGLYYSNQNPISGDIFIGGEKARLDEIFVADDTEISVSSKENISTIIPKLFTCEGSTEVRSVWSGIMGFTADHMPLVGRLPVSITGRGDGEWIAAGFNGYGVPQCWSAGEAVAKLVLGIDVSDFLPDAFIASEERLEMMMKMDGEARLRGVLGL